MKKSEQHHQHAAQEDNDLKLINRCLTKTNSMKKLTILLLLLLAVVNYTCSYQHQHKYKFILKPTGKPCEMFQQLK